MRFLISLLFILSIISCSDNKIDTPIDSPIQNINPGQWEGKIYSTYPGPDDGPINDSGDILLNFESITKYGWISLDSAGFIGIGTYDIVNDSIQFSQMNLPPTIEPYSINGNFGIERRKDTLVLTQILHPDSWSVCHSMILLPAYIR